MSRVMVQHAICVRGIAKLVSGLEVFPFIRIAVFSRWFLPSCLFYLSPCRSTLPPPLVLSRHAAARSHCLLFSPLRYNASHCSPNTLALSPARSPALPLPRSARFPTSHSTIPLRTRIPVGAAARSALLFDYSCCYEYQTTIAFDAMLCTSYGYVQMEVSTDQVVTHNPNPLSGPSVTLGSRPAPLLSRPVTGLRNHRNV